MRSRLYPRGGVLVRRLATRRIAALALACTAVAMSPAAMPPSRAVSTTPSVADQYGYWLYTRNGEVLQFGVSTPFLGNPGPDPTTGNPPPAPLNKPIVGMATVPQGDGYWLVGGDGGVFSYGDSRYLGGMGGQHLNQPVVGMAATPDGGGYWLVASDGGIFSFGDAVFYGSTGAIHLNQPIVGMTATPSGHGYWLVASDGGIFAFGDAGFHGSTGNIHLNQPIVAMAATATGRGYWLAASDGGIFAFGDAPFLGSMGAVRLNQPIVGMTASHDGGGYYLAASDGGIFTFGDAPFDGAGASLPVMPSLPIGGVVLHPARIPSQMTVDLGNGYFSADDSGPGHYGHSVAFVVTNDKGRTIVGAVVDFTVSGLPHGHLGAAWLYTNDSGRAPNILLDTVGGDSGTITATLEGTSLSATSPTVTVQPGVATHMLFTTQPTATMHGQAIAPAPAVGFFDAEGNLTNQGLPAFMITISLGSNPSGGTLGGTTSQYIDNTGTATFPDLTIDNPGSGYTLVADDPPPSGSPAPPLPPVTSAQFDIS